MKQTRLLPLAHAIDLPFIGYVIHKHGPSTGNKVCQSFGPHILHQGHEIYHRVVVSRWLWPENRTFLEVDSMVVTWWIVAFLPNVCKIDFYQTYHKTVENGMHSQ